MKKLNLAQTLGLLANAGVIAGIVFLAVELRQNNDFMAAEARANRMDIRRGSILRTMNNPALRQAVIKVSNGETLNEDEQLLLDLEVEATLVDFQYVYLEYHSGLLDYTAIPAENWRRAFHEPGFGIAAY